MKRYIISPITTYCEDSQLFETIVGQGTEGMPIYCVVMANTEVMSRRRANQLATILNNQVTIYRSSLI